MEISEKELVLRNDYNEYQEEYLIYDHVEIRRNLQNAINEVSDNEPNEDYLKYYEMATEFLLNWHPVWYLKSETKSEESWSYLKNLREKYSLNPIVTGTRKGEEALFEFCSANGSFFIDRKAGEKLYQISFIFHIKYFDKSIESFRDFMKHQLSENFNDDIQAFEIFIRESIVRYKKILPKEIKTRLILTLNGLKSSDPIINILKDQIDLQEKEIASLKKEINKKQIVTKTEVSTLIKYLLSIKKPLEVQEKSLFIEAIYTDINSSNYDIQLKKAGKSIQSKVLSSNKDISEQNSNLIERFGFIGKKFKILESKDEIDFRTTYKQDIIRIKKSRPNYFPTILTD